MAIEGIQASGQAGVFGSAINPLQVYMQQNANKQKRLDDQLKYDREQRDALISDLRKFNPDKVWDPFYQEVNEYVQNNVRDFANTALQKGAPVSAINPYLERRKGEANTLVSKINWLKSTYEQGAEGFEGDDYIIQDKALSDWNDVFFNGGKARKSYEIKDADKQRQAIANNPDNYDMNKVAVDFMKSLPTKVTQQWTEYWGQLGKEYNVQETQTKLGFQYKIGANGEQEVVLDPRTGQPKISMTDEVFTQALQNKYLKNTLDKYVGDQPKEVQREYLTKILEGQDPRSIKNRPQLGFKKTKEDDTQKWGINFGVPVVDLETRREWLQGVTTGARPDLLQAIGNTVKDFKAQYVGEGKDKKIRIEWATSLEQEGEGRPSVAAMLTAGKRKETKDIPIGTPEQRAQAEYLLNSIIDSSVRNAKQAIGPDAYIRYRDAYEKNRKSIDGFSQGPQEGFTEGTVIPGFSN